MYAFSQVFTRFIANTVYTLYICIVAYLCIMFMIMQFVTISKHTWTLRSVFTKRHAKIKFYIEFLNRCSCSLSATVDDFCLVMHVFKMKLKYFFQNFGSGIIVLRNVELESWLQWNATRGRGGGTLVGGHYFGQSIRDYSIINTKSF